MVDLLRTRICMNRKTTRKRILFISLSHSRRIDQRSTVARNTTRLNPQPPYAGTVVATTPTKLHAKTFQDVPGMKIKEVLLDVLEAALGTSPMIARLGNASGDSTLRSRTTSPNGVINAQASKMVDDMERHPRRLRGDPEHLHRRHHV
ncbi:hypothetical protein EDB81DRAFT_863039 [Dactylonectria macrodidyma]|uniref:Uncharacterized protein n=1 Tax=Dactylonectria macrodidyma TaxID=307937 RepID=A0A9P9I8T6_9HYPO|nr:hypothetical protein EDB81DRAFT_863039 [Dactylonectria macrodidyma]